MAACSVFAAAYLRTLDVQHISINIDFAATAACSRTQMSTGQQRSAGSQAPELFKTHVLRAFDVDCVPAVRNLLRNDDIAAHFGEIHRLMAGNSI
jgi:hypothetical protein